MDNKQLIESLDRYINEVSVNLLKKAAKKVYNDRAMKALKNMKDGKLRDRFNRVSALSLKPNGLGY